MPIRQQAQQITSHHTHTPHHATASREESDSSSTHHREISPCLELVSPLFALSCLSVCLSTVLTEASFSPFTYCILHRAAPDVGDIEIAIVLHISEHRYRSSRVGDPKYDRHTHTHSTQSTQSTQTQTQTPSTQHPQLSSALLPAPNRLVAAASTLTCPLGRASA